MISRKHIRDEQSEKPLRLYVDDITTEKLTSALADYGSTAVLSSEAASSICSPTSTRRTSTST